MAPYIETEPVLRWLDDEVVPRYGSTLALASVLASRTGVQPKSWCRFFIRLRNKTRVNLYTLDRLCTLLGEHISRFCDFHDFEEAAL